MKRHASRRCSVLWLIGAVLGVLLALARPAAAAPEAHILRIDPRAGVQGGAPLLTMVAEVVQFNPLSQVLAPCANSTGFNATLDCYSSQLEKPGSLWTSYAFPKDAARLLVLVEGSDQLATIDGDPKKWGDSQRQPNVGTAWLITLDASSGMGA